MPTDLSADNDDLNFVRTVAALMSIEYLTVALSEKDKEYLNIMEHSNDGKFPILLLEDGVTYLNEPLSIARVFSNNRFGFYGPDEI